MDNSILTYRKTRAKKDNKRVIEFNSMNRATLLFVKIAKLFSCLSFLGAFLSLALLLNASFSPFIPFLFAFVGTALLLSYSLVTGYFTSYKNRYGRTIKESKHTLKTEEKFYI